MLDLSKFVEAYLMGIEVDRVERKVVLSIKEPAGKGWILVATGVSELMVLQMCMQNIIDRISVWTGSAVDADCRERVFSLLSGRYATDRDDMESPLINRTVDAIQRGDSMLIELEPVYGASVLMLASGLSVAEA
ncbi:hypothetical protein PQR05_21605 [Paraburkholderia sediminicola]|uniref:hypothetical protein n=1 Tax=Paraburkholderia sediminicola TaxID=458836 RepID=UPI0038B8F4E1